MKIIYVTSSFPYGPGEAFIFPEIAELKRQGYEVLIVPMYPRGSVVHEDAKTLLDTTVFSPLFCMGILGTALTEVFRAPLRTVKALALLFRSKKVLMLLLNLALYPKGLWLAQYARNRGAMHIHAHWASYTATLAMVAGEVSGIPWSFTGHRYDIVVNNLLKEKVSKSYFTRFISESGLCIARTIVGDMPTGKVFILHMGVELPPSQPMFEASNGDMPVALCPANLVPVKGHRYLIEALAVLRELGVALELWLAGDGPLREELLLEMKAFSLSDRIKLLGHRPHEEIINFYRHKRVSFVVLPSVDLGEGLHEGIPVSLIEAMAYGVPVISTTTGGIPELIQSGCGLLVAPQDPIALANAIEAFVKSPDLRQRIGDAGRKRIEDSFDIKKIVAKLATRFETCSGPTVT